MAAHHGSSGAATLPESPAGAGFATATTLTVEPGGTITLDPIALAHTP